MNIPTMAAKIAAAGRVESGDVAQLRAALLDGNEIWPPEANSLFELAAMRLPACVEWRGFFADVMSGYVVNQLEPVGEVSEKNARWLIAMMNRSGEAPGIDELELMARVFEKAKSAPVSLQTAALNAAYRIAHERDLAKDRDFDAEAAALAA